MEVIRRDMTPDGVEIQFEEWKRNDTVIYIIGAYPISKYTSRYEWIRAGEPFRLTISSFDSLEQAAGIYDGIRAGIIKLTDDIIVERYWNGNQDKQCMGIL